MSICDLRGGTGRLQKATRELAEKWAETRDEWNDKTRRDFEERYLQPISPSVRLLMAHANELIELLHKAERECRDDMLAE